MSGPSKYSCAICADEIDGEPRYAALGKDDAIVKLCASCVDDKPDANSGHEPRGYQGGNGPAITREFGAEIDAAHIRVYGESNKQTYAHGKDAITRPRTLGWKLTRVAVRDDAGKIRDCREAWETIRGKPYGRRLRYIGCVAHWHLFEYAPSPVAPEIRDPFEAIEKFRVKPDA